MVNRVGQKIGNYQITTEIASGAFGHVYLAQHSILTNRKVALKLLRTALTTSQMRQQFLQEAQFLERLAHPHIIQIIDVGFHDDDIPYLAMEYAPNGSLRDRLNQWKTTPPTMNNVFTTLTQIGEALQYAHEQQIIHRDLKPENILFNQRQEALLADFGIATVLITTSIQQGVAITGTPPYMAPEQFRGINSKESDQYALGCIAYELVTGQQPFTAPDFVALGFLHHSQAPVPPSRHNPQIPPFIEQAILKAMAKERHERFPDITTFLKVLHGDTSVIATIIPNRSEEHIVTQLSQRSLSSPGFLTSNIEQSAIQTQISARQAQEASTPTPTPAYDHNSPTQLLSGGETATNAASGQNTGASAPILTPQPQPLSNPGYPASQPVWQTPANVALPPETLAAQSGSGIPQQPQPFAQPATEPSRSTQSPNQQWSSTPYLNTPISQTTQSHFTAPPQPLTNQPQQSSLWQVATPRQNKSTTRRNLLIGAGAVGLAAIGGGTWFALSDWGGSNPTGTTGTNPHSQSSTTPKAVNCTLSFSDEFQTGCDSRWEWLTEGEAEAKRKVTDGYVGISAPVGCDLYGSNTKAPKLLQPLEGNMVIETLVNFSPQYAYQGAGLLIWQGVGNFIRLEHGYGDSAAIVFEQEVDGVHKKMASPFASDQSLIRTSTDQVLLRLEQKNNTITASWKDASSTGSSWQTIGTTQAAITSATKFGLSVVNKPQGPNADPLLGLITASFGYVHVTCR